LSFKQYIVDACHLQLRSGSRSFLSLLPCSVYRDALIDNVDT
jgi:hypothetical protein